MNETLAFYAVRTVPAFPLGKPKNCLRYSMTPKQAALYRWVVDNRPHDRAFKMDFREAGRALGFHAAAVHFLTVELIDRGWICSVPGEAYSKYRLVHPVMRFKVPR